MKRFNALKAQRSAAKKLLFFALFFTAAAFAAFADGDFGLNDKVGMLVSLVFSPWVKGVACLALVAECIGLLTAGKNGGQEMFKKFIPWIVGTVLYLAAATITSSFMSDANMSDTKVKSDLGLTTKSGN